MEQRAQVRPAEPEGGEERAPCVQLGVEAFRVLHSDRAREREREEGQEATQAGVDEAGLHLGTRRTAWPLGALPQRGAHA